MCVCGDGSLVPCVCVLVISVGRRCGSVCVMRVNYRGKPVAIVTNEKADVHNVLQMQWNLSLIWTPMGCHC